MCLPLVLTKRRLVLAAGSFLLAAATADVGRAQVDEVGPPVGDVCRATFGDRPDAPLALEPVRLIRWALSVQPVSDAALDTNADGTTSLAEKQLALADPDFCARPGRSCTAEDAEALRSRRNAILVWINAGGGAHYRFERVRVPTPAERQDRAHLDPAFDLPGEAVQLGEMLNVPADFVRASCYPAGDAQAVASALPALPAPPAPADADAASPDAAGEPEPFLLAYIPRPRLEGFRLAATPDDLSADRGQLSTITPAEITLNSDRRARTGSVYARAAAGYAFDLGRDDGTSTSILPFALFERQEDNGRRTIDKVGAGSSLIGRRHGPAGRLDEVSVSPLYTTDTRADIQVGTFKLRYTPTLGTDSAFPLGQPVDLGWARAILHADLLTDVGEVYSTGGDDTALTAGTFVRPGGRVRGRIRGADDSVLSQFEVDGSLRYLYGAVGEPDHIAMFETGLSFVFPNQDHYRVRASYAHGSDEDTLEEQQVWRVSLGVRF
ncbi:hypothetical protein [Marinivivus vitaminiproducens]|uniref:hypothetical protein n=1 Tax=Marinivivus vitaminiproducens TaxID=3035935 RepID=UPI002799CB9C|nr:hypothetical protein P4R82_15430 [Geminicoccaceae bacterium SCSIO 64248]